MLLQIGPKKRDALPNWITYARFEPPKINPYSMATFSPPGANLFFTREQKNGERSYNAWKVSNGILITFQTANCTFFCFTVTQSFLEFFAILYALKGFFLISNFGVSFRAKWSFRYAKVVPSSWLC